MYGGGRSSCKNSYNPALEEGGEDDGQETVVVELEILEICAIIAESMEQNQHEEGQQCHAQDAIVRVW